MKKEIIITGLLIVTSFCALQVIDNKVDYSRIASSELIERNDDFVELKIEEELLTGSYTKYLMAKVLYTTRGILLVLSIIAIFLFLKALFPLAGKHISQYLYASSLHYNYRKYRIREVGILVASMLIISLTQYYMDNRLEAFPKTQSISHYTVNGTCYVITDKNTHKQLSSIEYYFFFYFFVYVYYISFLVVIVGIYFLFYIRLLPWFIEYKNF